jgi:hypothetical protein
MSSFNLDAMIVDLQFAPIPEEQAGETEQAHMLAVVGLQVPIIVPGQQPQAAVVGMGTISYRLNYELLTKLIDEATAARELVKPPSKLPKDFAIAGNQQQAEQFAKQLQDAQGGKVR